MHPIIAKFPDGGAHPIPSCLTATLKAIGESRSTATKNTCIVYFRGTGPQGEPIIVKRRRDGTDTEDKERVITSMYIGTKQRCSCPANGQYDEKVSINVMTEVGNLFCNGSITEENLYEARDKELFRQGYKSPMAKAKGTAKPT